MYEAPAPAPSHAHVLRCGNPEYMQNVLRYGNSSDMRNGEARLHLGGLYVREGIDSRDGDGACNSAQTHCGPKMYSKAFHSRSSL